MLDGRYCSKVVIAGVASLGKMWSRFALHIDSYGYQKGGTGGLCREAQGNNGQTDYWGEPNGFKNNKSTSEGQGKQK